MITSMNELKYRFLLNASNVFALEKQVKLIKLHKNAQNIFEKSGDDLALISNLEHDKLLKISERIEQNKSYERLVSEGVKMVLCEDPEYPSSFHHVKSPPHLLYVKGDFKQKKQLGISIIGTRRPNLYGRSQTLLFAAHLASSGVHIISGLAKGIDSIALNEALKCGGNVTGILGTGIDVIYPKENKELFTKMEKNGAIITEFSPGTQPIGHNFPWRNRLISGLGMGLLVTQASIKSGTSLTVKWALEQGKDVFAIPGPINCEYSKGPNTMIRDGAILTQSPHDILDYYHDHLQNHETGTSIESKLTPIKPPKSEEKEIPEKLKELGLSFEARDIEDLIERTGLDYTILTRKLNLEVAKGAVEKVPGGRYKVKSNR